MREGGEAVVLSSSGGESWRVGSEGVTDECSEHFTCCGAVPGGLDSQGLGEGPPGILMGRAVEQSMIGSLDFLLAPPAEPQFWPMAQEVGGR